MSHVSQRLQRLYDWTPGFRTVYKKPAPQEPNLFSVPQTSGQSGWIVFTYENNIPVCVYITSQECLKLPCCVDERICNDTFLRVEKVSKLEFIVSDIWMLNSNCVFACSNFQQRYALLKDFLVDFVFHVPGTLKLIHKSDMKNVKIRGSEIYYADIGSKGYFVEEAGDMVVVKKMTMPDCYEIKGQKGYLKVPDLKTSVFLRSKGAEFECRCTQNEDGSWSLIEKVLE
jgi:hypothetical protein